jgi:hypothetical protein
MHLSNRRLGETECGARLRGGISGDRGRDYDK